MRMIAVMSLKSIESRGIPAAIIPVRYSAAAGSAMHHVNPEFWHSIIPEFPHLVGVYTCSVIYPLFSAAISN